MLDGGIVHSRIAGVMTDGVKLVGVPFPIGNESVYVPPKPVKLFGVDVVFALGLLQRRGLYSTQIANETSDTPMILCGCPSKERELSAANVTGGHASSPLAVVDHLR
jgi:hypothetical protein